MNATLEIAETPERHIREIQQMEALDRDSLVRLMSIASMYADADPETIDERTRNTLLYELKVAREQFGLWDEITISRALKVLSDPSGW